MKNLTTLTIAICILFAFTSCSKRAYVSENFEERAESHKTIAILPFDVQFVGKMPVKMTEEDILNYEDRLSIEFQREFYSELIEYAGRKRKRLNVQLKSIHTTNKILKDNNIGLANAWSQNEQELIEILGVDAIVRGNVIYNRIMSDGASFGISLGTTILNTVSIPATGLGIPSNLDRSKYVTADFSIVDNKGDEILWAIDGENSSNYSRDANTLVEQISRQAVQEFPYIEKVSRRRK